MTTVIKCHNKSGYAIGIHEGKGVHVKNLNIIGPGIGRDERFKPHSAIAIDPNAARKGSTDCKFENLNIEGFAVGVAAAAAEEVAVGEIADVELQRQVAGAPPCFPPAGRKGVAEHCLVALRRGAGRAIAGHDVRALAAHGATERESLKAILAELVAAGGG
jgi:hypothetical protein